MSGDLQKEYLVNLMRNISELEYMCDVTLVAGVDGEKYRLLILEYKDLYSQFCHKIP